MKYTYIIIYIFILIIIILSIPFNKNNSCYISSINPLLIQKLDIPSLQQTFTQNNIVLINNIFTNEFFTTLKDNISKEIQNITFKRNTSFKSIRRANTIKSSDLINIDIIKQLYYSTYFIDFLKNITNLSLENVSCNDEASMNLLIYDEPNDFITWHKDPNHYIGTRLTILINIVNENKITKDLSMSELQYIIDGKQYSIKMRPNSMIIFNGSNIEHQATPIGPDDNRIILSFTYCDICQENGLGYLFKNIKETVLGY